MVIGHPLLQRLSRKTVLVNLADLVLAAGVRGWWRNLTSNGPALGSMALLLLLVGLVGAFGAAGLQLLNQEAGQAAVLHVYLRDDAAPERVQALEQYLRSERDVVSVAYVSRSEALARARQRPTLAALAQDAGDNPFPAGFDVRVDSVADVARVDASVHRDAVLDPVVPTSYDRGAYGRLQAFLLVLMAGAGGFALLLAGVAVAVTANSVRAAVVARLDEVGTMRLVGAPRWMVRAPFVVEGALTGLAAGVLAGAGVAAVCALVIGEAGQALAGVLPGFGYGLAAAVALSVITAGLLLGALAGLGGVRRMPA